MKTPIRVSSIPLVVLGNLYGKTRADLRAILRGEKPDDDLSGLPDIKRGNALEPIARDLLARDLGVSITGDQSEVRTTAGDIVGHIDGRYVTPNGSRGIVEIKCPRSGRVQSLECGVPPQYIIQALIYAALDGADYATIGVFDVDNWRVHSYTLPLEQHRGYVLGWISEVRLWVRECIEGGLSDDEWSAQIEPQSVPVVGRTVRTEAELTAEQIAEAEEAICLERERQSVHARRDEIVESLFASDRTKIKIAAGSISVGKSGIRVTPRGAK